jgi:hypothetical protein
MDIPTYRKLLGQALKAMKEPDGTRTWSEGDVEQMVKGYSDTMIKDAMQHQSPDELAEFLSL